MSGTGLGRYGDEGQFHVVLANFNDYDITARLIEEMSFEYSWSQKDGDKLIISRNGIIWMEA